MCDWTIPQWRPRDDVVGFMTDFARVERALKAAGFRRGEVGQHAKVSWSRYAEWLTQNDGAALWDRIRQNPAYEDILRRPPKREVLADNDMIVWDQPLDAPQNIAGLIDVVKRARNNLFHGGKMGLFGGDDAPRSYRVIRMAHGILHELAGANERVRQELMGDRPPDRD